MIKRTTRKVKVAILFGYSGNGYHGMQIQPEVKTIEQEMLNALGEAGFIAECNANDTSKVNLMRCARTDKGVHALGQVINIKLDMKSDDLEEAKKNLNLILPESFRIWDILKTTKGFHSKDMCSSRHYNYWLPTYIFDSKKDWQTQTQNRNRVCKYLEPVPRTGLDRSEPVLVDISKDFLNLK